MGAAGCDHIAMDLEPEMSHLDSKKNDRDETPKEGRKKHRFKIVIVHLYSSYMYTARRAARSQPHATGRHHTRPAMFNAHGYMYM